MSTDSWFSNDELIRALQKPVIEFICARQAEKADISIKGEDIQDEYSAKHT
jgi:hypothetical protein